MSPQLLVKTPAVLLSHDASTDWLYVEWRGEMELPLVQEGCSEILRYLRTNKTSKILCDNSLVTTANIEGITWAAYHWLPIVRETGLRYVAWVYSSKLINRATFDQLHTQFTGTPVIATFDDLASACLWLRQQPDTAPLALG